jgi:hypothetical protein
MRDDDERAERRPRLPEPIETLPERSSIPRRAEIEQAEAAAHEGWEEPVGAMRGCPSRGKPRIDGWPTGAHAATRSRRPYLIPTRDEGRPAQPAFLASSARSVIRIRPRPSDTAPASSAWRSTRFTVARDVPARLARSSCVRVTSISVVWSPPA